MTRDSILRDWTLVLASGEIVRMGPVGTVSLPAHAEIRDLDGGYVLPGLVDAHVHLREPTPGLALFPANGVTTVINQEGQPAHLALRDSVLENDVFAPRLTESDLNDLGYGLLEQGDLQRAIEVFRLNVRLHPTSANVHDSLGEAYLAADRLDEAERTYRRALELDPTMDSARRGLRAIAEKRCSSGACD